MESFKKFTEVAALSAMRKIRKGLGKTYRPGEFGIEIEFRASNEAYESEPDYEGAWEQFHRDVDRPPSVKEWETDNPEPERPNPDDYRWNPKDLFSNYYNLDLEEEPFPQPLPDSVEHLVNSRSLSSEYRRVLSEIYFKLKSLAKGNGDTRLKREIFRSDEEFYKYRSQIRATLSYFDPRKIPETDAGGAIEDIKKFFVETWDWVTNFFKWHEDRAKGLQESDYRKRIISIFRGDIANWRENRKEWEEERDKIERAHNDWDQDAEFERWFDRNSHHFEQESDKDAAVEKDIHRYDNWFRSRGIPGWYVHKDSEDIVELTSPILNASHFGQLKTVLDKVSEEETDGRTGLHVHIGMPQNTDAFDLIAMIQLTDEQPVARFSQRPIDAMQQYAKPKSDVFWMLYTGLDSGVYHSDQLINLLSNAVDRNLGINFVKAFLSHHTVEFRYLTSQVINEPERLFEMINYFLVLPRIAKTRTQIKVRLPGNSWIVFTRRPGGQVEIAKDRKVAQTQDKVQNLRQSQPQQQSLKDRLQAKFQFPKQGQSNAPAVRSQ